MIVRTLERLVLLHEGRLAARWWLPAQHVAGDELGEAAADVVVVPPALALHQDVGCVVRAAWAAVDALKAIHDANKPMLHRRPGEQTHRLE